MAERRLIYLVLLTVCLVFYWAYREWLSWFLLMAVVFLPWLSLVLSLPAMLSCRLRVNCAAEVPMGCRSCVTLAGKGLLPLPDVKGVILVKKPITDQQWKVKHGDSLPTEHCGQLNITLKRAWCYDYLGLFRLPVRHRQAGSLLVRPNTVIVENPPDISRYLANAWRPKPGGGFAENHELRLYRPGDSLRQVHWKLSAKTGKLVYREPMEALRGLAVLSVRLSGTPTELDDKLGRLQYLSAYLLSQDIPHRICCLTGTGVQSWNVEREGDLPLAMARLLNAPPATQAMSFGFIQAAWRFHIGGDGDEA